MEQHSWLYGCKCKVCGKETLNTPQTFLCDDCWERKYIFNRGENMEAQENKLDKLIKDSRDAFVKAFKSDDLMGIKLHDTLNELQKKSNEKLESAGISVGKKDDSEKLRWDLLDPDFPEGIVKILTFGARKYADNNWRKLIDNGGTERCYAALMRHLTEWRKGNKIDNESGFNHLFHAACNLYFLNWFDEQRKEKS